MSRWKSSVGLPNFNPDARRHPCMSCQYGGVWTEQLKPAGNYCKHPEILNQRGLAQGRYHSLKRVPAWCPKRKDGDPHV